MTKGQLFTAHLSDQRGQSCQSALPPASQSSRQIRMRCGLSTTPWPTAPVMTFSGRWRIAMGHLPALGPQVPNHSALWLLERKPRIRRVNSKGKLEPLEHVPLKSREDQSSYYLETRIQQAAVSPVTSEWRQENGPTSTHQGKEDRISIYLWASVTP